ncbi:DMT family transporter [bacterium]|nr:DMT family transporter [bacterium]
MNKFLKGFLAMIGAVIAWSSLEVTGSYIFAEGAGTVTLLSIRFLFATLLFGGVILFQKYKTGENLFLIDKIDIPRFIGNGVFLALHLLVYWFAWELLDPNLAVIYGIFYMYPLALVLVAVFHYGEKFSNNRKIAVALGTIGALFAVEFLPSFSTEGLNMTGILLDVAAVITWVGYLMIGQGIVKKYKALTIVFYDFLQVFVYVSLFQLPTVTIAELNPHNLLAILYLAVVASFIAYLCYWTGVKNIGASNSGMIELATPIIGVTLAYFFLSTDPSLYQMGGLLMLVGSTYLIYREKEVVYDQ